MFIQTFIVKLYLRLCFGNVLLNNISCLILLVLEFNTLGSNRGGIYLNRIFGNFRNNFSRILRNLV